MTYGSDENCFSIWMNIFITGCRETLVRQHEWSTAPSIFSFSVSSFSSFAARRVKFCPALTDTLTCICSNCFRRAIRIAMSVCCSFRSLSVSRKQENESERRGKIIVTLNEQITPRNQNNLKQFHSSVRWKRKEGRRRTESSAALHTGPAECSNSLGSFSFTH